MESSESIYDKISRLFYSTDERNQTIALELVQQQPCYERWINDQYEAWLALPWFVEQAAQTAQERSEAVQSVDDLITRQQQLARFAKTYFKPQMRFQGWEHQPLTRFPRVLLECVFLEELDLAWNHLESLPEDIHRLDQLRILNLLGNEGLKQLPAGLAQLEQLEELVFQGTLELFATTEITPLLGEQQVYRLPEFFRQMPNLRRLCMDHVLLDALPEWLPEMRQLQHLEVSSGLEFPPYLTLPESLMQLPQLRMLGISGYMTHIPPEIHQLHQLECLRVTLALTVPRTIAQLPQLKSLNLSDLSLSYTLTNGQKLHRFQGDRDLPKGQSRIQLYGWEWIKELHQLEEFIFMHEAPYHFTHLEYQELQTALPNCHFMLEGGC